MSRIERGYKRYLWYTVINKAYALVGQEDIGANEGKLVFTECFYYVSNLSLKMTYHTS